MHNQIIYIGIWVVARTGYVLHRTLYNIFKTPGPACSNRFGKDLGNATLRTLKTEPLGLDPLADASS